MLRRTLLLLSLLALSSSAMPGSEQTFRVRLHQGHPALPDSDPHKKQLTDFKAVAGHEFSYGSRELGWSISGVISSVDAQPCFTGHVMVSGTAAKFENAA